MSENVEIFKRFMVEGFEGGNLDVVDELISPDIVEHQFGFEGSGEEVRDKLKKAITDLHGFLHGLHYTFDDIVAVGDMVWARMTATSTCRGALPRAVRAIAKRCTAALRRTATKAGMNSARRR